MDINSLLEQMPSFLRNPERDEQITQYQGTQRLSYNASRQETQDITLTTEEGDVVTISSLQDFQTSYYSFDYIDSIKGQSLDLDAEKFTTSSNNAFSISVQGDLSEEEQADIAWVLAEMDGIMDDLVNGDMEGILQSTQNLMDETDTIAGIDAVLKFHQQVSLEQQTVIQYQSTGTEYPASNQDSSTVFSSLNDYMAKINDQMLELIENSTVENEKLEQPLNQKFNEYISRLTSDIPDAESSLKTQLIEQIQNNINDTAFSKVA